MADKKDAARMSAEARFKRKEDQAREGAQAMAEYEAKAQAARDNMARLRELRLAQEAKDARLAAKDAREKAAKKENAAKEKAARKDAAAKKKSARAAAEKIPAGKKAAVKKTAGKKTAAKKPARKKT